jgi:glycosyltransferase involved in cell wall biosynthesis
VRQVIAEVDPKGEFIRYLGYLPSSRLPEVYEHAHALVFASSCENLPNTLLEAMAFGIPVLSSSYPPMYDIFKGCCGFFDPYHSDSIVSAVRSLVSDWDSALLRIDTGMALAERYSWDACADATFSFLHESLRRSSGRFDSLSEASI